MSKKKPGKISKAESRLSAYSEWLDTNQLLKPPEEEDWRTHLDLVREYRKETKSDS